MSKEKELILNNENIERISYNLALMLTDKKTKECSHEWEFICNAGGKFETGELSQCKKCMKIKSEQKGIGSLM